jgi:RNA polymerase sigma factor (sigma-70 family)
VDELDFSEVYTRHAQDVYRFALYLSGNAHVAQDVTAETFARAWVARGRIRLGSVKAYLLVIARNLCRDVARHPPDGAQADHDVADTVADQERTVRAREELGHVLRALRELPELDRTVLAMATIEGLSHQAIAEAVGLSVPAIKVRIHRARVRLNAARGYQEGQP